jgi:hypothetical protein
MGLESAVLDGLERYLGEFFAINDGGGGTLEQADDDIRYAFYFR